MNKKGKRRNYGCKRETWNKLNAKQKFSQIMKKEWMKKTLEENAMIKFTLNLNIIKKILND